MPRAAVNPDGTPRKRKRRPRYDRKILPVVRACATFGATREEIAAYIEISWRCFYDWMLQYPELAQAVKRGQVASDDRMEDNLYRTGLNGNVTAQIFWLKNRRPDRWRDVQHLDQAIGHYIISDSPMTEDEWIEARTKAKQIEHNTLDVTANTLDVIEDDADFGTKR